MVRNELLIRSHDPTGFKAIGIADAHFSPASPPAWKVSYWDEQKKVMEQVIRLIKRERIDVVIWAGDIFHKKAPTRNPHWFVAELMRIFQKIRDSGAVNVGILGNHDLKYGSLEGLKGQPAEVLIQARELLLLDTTDVVIECEDHRIRISGASYRHTTIEQLLELKKGNVDKLIVVGHFWFGQKTGVYYSEQMYGPDILVQGEADLYLVGHHHQDQGIRTHDGKIYVSVGALSRTGRGKEDWDRRTAASLICSGLGGRLQAKTLRPKDRPKEEAMDLSRLVQQGERENRIREFVTQLSSVQVGSANTTQILDSMDLETEVRKRVERFLDEAE